MKTESTEKALTTFAELVIERMESISTNWEKPWIDTQMKGLPENLAGRRYNGTNAFLLFLLCANQGYHIPCFLTFAQAKSEGLSINKGAKSFPVIYYNFIVKEISSNKKIPFEDYKNLSKEEQKKFHVTAYMKYYNVFNVAQTNIRDVKPNLWDQLVSKFSVKAQNFDTNKMIQCKELDTLIEKQAWLCKIYSALGNEPYYDYVLDEIHIPDKQQFNNGESFYGTLLHEMTHSTGAESRLNRQISVTFGSEAYGREELVAELTAAFTLCSMGISSSILKENVQYLNGWCQNIRKNPQFLMTILSDVSKASALINQEIEKLDISVKKTNELNYDQSLEITLTEKKYHQVLVFSESNCFIDPAKDEIRIAVPGKYVEELLNATRLMKTGSRLIRSHYSSIHPDIKLTELVITPIEAFPYTIQIKKMQLENQGDMHHAAFTGEFLTVTKKKLESSSGLLSDQNKGTNPLLKKHSLKEGDTCHLQRVFEQTGTISFTGSDQINSAEDVAWIFKSLENASIENAFAVYVTNEKAVVQHLSIGSFNETFVPQQSIVAAVEKLKPSKLFLVHNHPSGCVKASFADKTTIHQLSKAFDKVDVCGIIINQTSGKYGLFTDSVDEKLEFTKNPTELFEIPVFSFNRLVFEKDYSPDKLEQIKSPADVSKFVSSHRLGKRNKVNILVLNTQNKITANIFSDFTSASMQNAKQIAKEAVNATILFGGHSYILNSNIMISKEVCKAISDYSLKFSGESIKPSDIISEVSSSDYVSAVEDGILNEDIYVSEQTKDRIFESMKEAINIGTPVISTPFKENNLESFREFASEFGFSPVQAMKVYGERKTELGNYFCTLLKREISNHGIYASYLNFNSMDNIKKVDESRINWEELKSKFGITKEILTEKDVLRDMLYFKKSNKLVKVSYETATGHKEFDCRVQFTEKNGSYTLRFYPVKESLDLSKPYMGYSFTDEDKKNMLETGNLGRVARIKTFDGRENDAYLSVDPLTNEVVHVFKNYIKIKDEINGVPISADIKNQLYEGKSVFLTGMKSAKGKQFDAFVQIDANRHGIGFNWQKPELIEDIYAITEIKGVPIDKTIQTKLAAGEKVEMTGLQRRVGGTFDSEVSFDPEAKKLKFDFPQKQTLGTSDIFVPKKLKGVLLSDTQQISINNGEKVLVQGMESSKGTKFDAYVYINPQEGKLNMEFPVKNKFLGVEFSQEQMDKLQAGNAVWVSGLQKKDGRTFKAPLLWDAKKGKFSFLQLDKKQNVNNAPSTPPLSTDKEEKLEEKSQKQDLKPNIKIDTIDKKKGRKL